MNVENLLERLKENTGTEFQKNFTKLMKKKFNDDYQGTQTYGNNGDRGLDGILKSKQIGYLIYAPEDFKEKYVIQKLDSDYNNFFSAVKDGYWKGIKELRFIIKTKREGLTANILKKVDELQSKCDLVLSLCTFGDIEEEFSSFILVKPSANKFNELYTAISRIKDVYNETYRIFERYDFNTNNLLSPSEEKYANDYHNLCICNYNEIVTINCIRTEYKRFFEEIDLNDKMEELIEGTPKYYDDYICFSLMCEYLYRDNKKDELIDLCDKCLEVIKHLC